MAKQYIIEIDNSRILKRAECSSESTFAYMQALCEHLIRTPHPEIVPVLSFHTVSKGFFHYRYNYTMQKMNHLSNFEKSVIHIWSGINDVADSVTPKKYTEEEAESITKAGLEYCPKLVNLMEDWQHLYFDIHAGNIMKDDDGEYRLIDLEGFDRDEYWFSDK